MRLDRRELIGSALALAAMPGAALARADGDAAHPGLILGPGPAGRCDDAKVGVGVLRRDERARRWLLWYYARDRAYRADAPATLGTGRIALATSRDGRRWTRIDGPGFGGAVLEPGPQGSYDHVHLGLTDVSRVGDQWYMWTFGGDETPLSIAGQNPIGLRMRPGLARSRDGIHWEKLPGRGPGGALIDWQPDQAFAAWTNGLNDGEKFVMFHTTTPIPPLRFDTHVSFSRDGVNWAPQGPIMWDRPAGDFAAAGEMTRHVQPNPFPALKGRWLMLYTAMDGSKARFQRRTIAAALSDDLINWRRLFDGPVFEPAAESQWDGGGVSAPQLVVHGRQLWMSYFGFPVPARDKALPKGVGLAVAKGRDLRALQRV